MKKGDPRLKAEDDVGAIDVSNSLGMASKPTAPITYYLLLITYHLPESDFFHLERACNAAIGVMLSVSQERISSRTISSSLKRAPV